MCWSFVALPVKTSFGNMTRWVRGRFCAAIRIKLLKNITLQPKTRGYNAIVARISELTRGLLSK
jgi:hypothetical protein